MVRLNVENKVTKWFPVKYYTTGEVAEGYMVADINLETTTLKVSGPQSVVEQISYAGGEIDVPQINMVEGFRSTPPVTWYPGAGVPM